MSAVAARAQRVRRIYRNDVDALRDRRLGARTSDEIKLADLDSEGPSRKPYEPSGWSALPGILPRAEVGSSDVFLDLGAGMGRVVHVAATMHELHPADCLPDFRPCSPPDPVDSLASGTVPRIDHFRPWGSSGYDSLSSGGLNRRVASAAATCTRQSGHFVRLPSNVDR